jgi:20S proteasome subunit beta 2
MAIFETMWKPDLTREDAIKLCSSAIEAGIFNDLGSGSNVDVCVITPEKATLLRNHIKPNEREKKLRDYRFPKGTTAVLNEKVVSKAELSKFITVHELEDDDDVPQTAEKMDVDPASGGFGQ